MLYPGLGPSEAAEKPYIASMGIYVFKKSVLVDLLKNKYPKANDFGGEIIPWAANDGYKVKAYLHNDYWEDIGTIKSFFEANLALAAQVGNDLSCTRTIGGMICQRGAPREAWIVMVMMSECWMPLWRMSTSV